MLSSSPVGAVPTATFAFDAATFDLDDEKATRGIKNEKISLAFLVMAVVVFAPSNRKEDTVALRELLKSIINSTFSGAAVIVGYLSYWNESCHFLFIILMDIIVDLVVNARLVWGVNRFGLR